MKQLFTTASLILIMANSSSAQEKITVKKEKEPCFVSEFDANGNEIKVPCGTKSALPPSVPQNAIVTVNSEHDPATGATKNYILDFDAAGKEIKMYGRLVEEINPQGLSVLLFKYRTAVGVEKTVPAKRAK